MESRDVVIIGGGAAGLMCAAVAAARGRSTLVLEHARRVGRKILMSGGGRCNFTNLHSGPEHFLSANPHFARSALSRYQPRDFIELVDRHGIAWHEKKLGQLFCDHSSKDIVAMLEAECAAAGAEIRTRTTVTSTTVAGRDGAPRHRLEIDAGTIECDSLVIATGGLSIPTMGATGFAYDLARELGIPLQETRAGLVPVTLSRRERADFEDLAGVSLDTEVQAERGPSFRENILFTHRGLSGPAILQASSYWLPGETLSIDLFPGVDLAEHVRSERLRRPRIALRTLLAEQLTRRVARRWCENWLPDAPLDQLGDDAIGQLVEHCQPWRLRPAGTEGWRTAEVTLGGIDTRALSSKTLECRDHPGLWFIGEAVDVTGHLGGHNFQWAWASAHAAAQYV
jgi:predicted Rossmann fold flavoprotein